MLAEEHVFGCDDLRRVILSYVYPTKITVGMSIITPTSSGKIEQIRKVNDIWYINLSYGDIDHTNCPYSVTTHLRGKKIKAKVISSKI
jgi:hypothetical protein